MADLRADRLGRVRPGRARQGRYLRADLGQRPRERDPKDWTLQGSADGKDWKTWTPAPGETFAERFQTKSYDLPAPSAEYQHFRLDITKNNGAGDITQLADVQFSTGDPPTPRRRTCCSLVDRGPSGSPTAKASAGFTGKRALRYAGTHKADGRAYSYNKIFDVNVAVSADTELSYRIFPSMADGDLDYDATNVVGGPGLHRRHLLSDLHGRRPARLRADAAGPGRAKVLYVNQWNNVDSRIGSVAAGKTVDRILVAYDSPEGPGEVPGLARRRHAAAAAPREADGASVRLRARPPAAPTPAAASPAATTSRRRRCRTASTSGRR